MKGLNIFLPDMLEQFEALAGGRLFTQLDLATGLLQIQLNLEAQAKTTFVTPNETRKFTRMSFGMAVAVGEFLRLMKKVLRNLQKNTIRNYLDDGNDFRVIVDSKSHTKAFNVLFRR